MNYHHIIWDFDGTLFNTYPALNHAIRLAAADLGAVVAADRVARLLNQTLALCVETLAMDYRLDRAVFEDRIAHYRAKVTPDDQPPIPGALEVCARFKKAGGKNFIFSHRDQTLMGLLLTRYEAEALFEAVVSVDDGYPRKPSPAGFLGVISRFGLDPESVLAVGDRLLDVLAADQAGIDACVLAPETVMEIKARHTIHHMSELIDILGLD